MVRAYFRNFIEENYAFLFPKPISFNEFSAKETLKNKG
jgi:hypothetical protein